MPGFDLFGKLNIDTSQVAQVPAQMQAAMAAAPKVAVTAQVNVNAAPVAALTKSLDTIATTPLTVKVGYKFKTGEEDIFKWHQKLVAELQRTTELKHSTTKAQANLTAFEGTFKEVLDRMESKGQETGQVLAKAIPATIGAASTIGTKTQQTATGGGAAQGQSYTQVALQGLGAIAGGATLKGVIDKALGTAAGGVRMEESVKRMFGSAGDGVASGLKNLSDSTGYIDDELLQSISIYGELQGSIGLTTSQLQNLVGITTDIARTTGLPGFRDDITGVTQALMYGLQGSGLGLRKLGVRIDENYMKNEYLGGMYKETWAKMDMAARGQAYYNAIMAQTADVAGAAANSQGSYTSASLQATKRLHEAWAKVGTTIMPVATWVLNTIAKAPTGLIAVGIAITGAAAAGVAAIYGIAALVASIRLLGKASTTAAMGNAGGATASAGSGSLIARIFHGGLLKAAPAAEASAAKVMGGVFRGSYSQMMERVQIGAMGASSSSLAFAGSMGGLSVKTASAAGAIEKLKGSIANMAGGWVSALSSVGIAAAVAIPLISAVWDATTNALKGPKQEASLSEINATVGGRRNLAAKGGDWTPMTATDRGIAADIYGQPAMGGMTPEAVNAAIDSAEANALVYLQAHGKMSKADEQAYATQLQQGITDRLQQSNLTKNPAAAAQQTITIILQPQDLPGMTVSPSSSSASNY